MSLDGRPRGDIAPVVQPAYGRAMLKSRLNVLRIPDRSPCGAGATKSPNAGESRMRPQPVRRGRLDVTPLVGEDNDRRWDDWTLKHLGGPNSIIYLAGRWHYEQLLFREIQRHVPPGGRILEVGSGAGPNTLWLATKGYATVGVEYRPQVVDAARNIAERLGISVRYEVGDAMDLAAYRGFDVAFSVGMVEHWPYEQAVHAVAEQAKSARTVLVNVPTRHTKHSGGSVTDERFYRRSELRRMLEDAGLRDVDVIGYGVPPGPMGHLTRAMVPDIPLRWVLQRRLGWPSGSLLAVGHTAYASPGRRRRLTRVGSPQTARVATAIPAGSTRLIGVHHRAAEGLGVRASSLYRCPSCEKVVRDAPSHGLVCMCDALPLGSERVHPFDQFGAGRVGPPRPYYRDREHPMVEFEDDGRVVVADLREAIWIG
jgi:SAM-dependent methyltransferase